MDQKQVEQLKKFREMISDFYSPLHPHLYKPDKNIFEASFLETMKANCQEKSRQFLKEVHPQIFTFPIFTPDFCKELLEEVAHFENWCHSVQLHINRPNTMNNYGAVLDDFGFWPFLQKLMGKAVSPFSSFLYPDAGGDSLDFHHGFIVEYQIGKDTSLDFHVDNSEVTLNVCLGKEFKGGNIYFGGIRCDQHQQTEPKKEEQVDVTHKPGYAILHRGKHRHAALKIEEGERFNLILWCMSSAYQKQTQECPDWCDWPRVNQPV